MEKQLFINWMLNPAHRMTLTYVISLTIIAALSIFVHFTLDKIIIEQIVSGKLINVSGQQRMLSQRTVLYTNQYIARGIVTDKKKALFALNKMNKNYHYLLKEHFEKLKQNQVSPLSEPMSALYFSEPHNIARKMTEFSSLINQILDRPRSSIDTQSNLEGSIFLFMAKEQILNSFNITVKLYEVESSQKIHELRTTQQLLLIIIILTILIECLFFITPLSIKSNRYSKSLYEEANHDYLTNLLNRRSFAVLAKQFVAIGKRYHSDLSVISFDIDLFKSINDKYGHDLGDKVIQNVAGTIQENCRDSDSVFRFGGEEFLILLPKTSMSEAIKLAEKIRSTITNSPTLADKLIIEVTASAGVSQWDSEEKNIESALKRADDALYQAKKQGRDRVVAG
jgi:diguanylate cyclase (GGDEF)-like protein